MMQGGGRLVAEMSDKVARALGPDDELGRRTRVQRGRVRVVDSPEMIVAVLGDPSA